MKNDFPLMTLLALCAAAVISGGCGRKDSTADSASTVSSTTPPAASPAASAVASASAPAEPSTFSDANIIAKEIAGDSAEVVLAGVAKAMATDPAVQAYAAQLVLDHSRGMKETIALATKLSIAPESPAGDTTSLGTSHMRTRLQGLSKGPAFDTVFVNHEIEDHKDDIKDAKLMRGVAKDARLKALIEKSIPELQKHLDRAEKIAAATK